MINAQLTELVPTQCYCDMHYLFYVSNLLRYTYYPPCESPLISIDSRPWFSNVIWKSTRLTSGHQSFFLDRRVPAVLALKLLYWLTNQIVMYTVLLYSKLITVPIVPTAKHPFTSKWHIYMYVHDIYMMASWHENAFRITVPLSPVDSYHKKSVVWILKKLLDKNSRCRRFERAWRSRDLTVIELAHFCTCCCSKRWEWSK